MPIPSNGQRRGEVQTRHMKALIMEALTYTRTTAPMDDPGYGGRLARLKTRGGRSEKLGVSPSPEKPLEWTDANFTFTTEPSLPA